MTALRKFFDWNKQISSKIQKRLDNVVPRDRGWSVFTYKTIPGLLKPNSTILDIGGGKRPQISPEKKKKLRLTVIGADIDENELKQAPEGSYDRTVIGDIGQVALREKYDLIFSCAVLEHVKDPEAAIKNMANALAPGGIMAHFVPCRYALFAIINRVLSPNVARKILFTFHPEKTISQGFPAYYHDALPSKYVQFYNQERLKLIDLETHYASDYATFFFPLYIAEAIRQIVVKFLKLSDFSETFTIIGQKEIENGNAIIANPTTD